MTTIAVGSISDSLGSWVGASHRRYDALMFRVRDNHIAGGSLQSILVLPLQPRTKNVSAEAGHTNCRWHAIARLVYTSFCH